MSDQYKQNNPSGLGAETTAGAGADRHASARFGAWLAALIGDNASLRAQIETLSGIAGNDMTQLLEGHPAFLLDTDHVQRLSTALVESGVITDSADVWNAAGQGQSDYITPPARIVDAMSGGETSA